MNYVSVWAYIRRYTAADSESRLSWNMTAIIGITNTATAAVWRRWTTFRWRRRRQRKRQKLSGRGASLCGQRATWWVQQLSMSRVTWSRGHRSNDHHRFLSTAERASYSRGRSRSWTCAVTSKAVSGRVNRISAFSLRRDPLHFRFFRRACALPANKLHPPSPTPTRNIPQYYSVCGARWWCWRSTGVSANVFDLSTQREWCCCVTRPTCAMNRNLLS